MTLSNSTAKADRALNTSAIIWFLVAVTGQWLFVYYIIIHYGGSLVQGDIEAYSKSSIIGHAKGDPVGNLMFVAHVLMAAIITLEPAFSPH